MIIYKDIISGDEMFSDAFKIEEVHGGFMYSVEGKGVSRTDSIDEKLLGANPSAEEISEGNDATTSSGVDIILNHKLVLTHYSKKQYTGHIKDYMKALKSRLEKDNPERLGVFVKGMPDVVTALIKNFGNYAFYTGESMDTEGMVGLLDYREDGITPFMLFFKDGLEIEKC